MKLFTIDSSIARRIGGNLGTLRETFIKSTAGRFSL
jgi:hypothetical protein